MIEHIPELIEAGIDSFKIEGRMKTALYVATVARTYRLAIDDFLKDPELYKSRIPFYKSEISKCTYRQYTTAYFQRHGCVHAPLLASLPARKLDNRHLPE